MNSFLLFKLIGKTILGSLLIYLTIATALITISQPVEMETETEGVGFEFAALTAVSYDDMPELQPYTARDGADLSFRFYESSEQTDSVLILLHGSSWHGMQFHPLAAALSAEGAAHIFVPDLRGHGFSPHTRGDVHAIGQLEDDVADLIAVARTQFPAATIILGGHSSGGGLTVRFAGGSHGEMADAFLLLAPYLGYDAPTTRPDAGGWARPLTGRIIGLRMLNAMGIDRFNGLTVIQFAMPQSVLDGPLGHTVTTAYSYRLNTSFAPRPAYGDDLAAIQQPFLLVAGLEDESFIPSLYEPTIAEQTASGSYYLLPNQGHLDLLTATELTPIVHDWLKNGAGQNDTAAKK